jgi:hypothetical protein
LERGHKSLETEIAEGLLKRPADNPTVADFKRRRLQIRDEIEQLRGEQSTSGQNLDPTRN